MLERARGVLKALTGLRQPGGRMFTIAQPTEAGMAVSDDSAMRFATVHACVRVLSEDVAALPLHVYRRTQDGGKERAYDHPLYELLHDRPNPEMSATAFKEAMMVNALLSGNGYAFIEMDRAGRVKALYPLLASEVTPYRTDAGELRYRAGGEDLRAMEVFHLAGLGFDGLMGLSPIAYARESIGLGVAAERYGEKFFRQGTHIGGVVSVKDELNDAQFERLKQQFAASFRGLQNAHGVPVLEGGATYTPVGIAPEDAQFLETRKFQRNEIAAIYRVPPHMIGDLERATFSNIEQQDLAYLQRGLLPWLMRWEQEIRAKLVPADQRKSICIEHDTANFMRGETSARMQAYSTAIMAGIMTPNEARRRENLNPMPGGDDIMLPLNMLQAGQKSPGQSASTGQRAFRRFIPGGERRAAGAGSIAAEMEQLGVSRAAYEQLRKGFDTWLRRQAEDIRILIGVEATGRSLDGAERRSKASLAEKNRLLRLINDYYKELSEKGTQDLDAAIAAGEFPGWNDVSDAIRGIAQSTWRQIADELGEANAPSESWCSGYIGRYHRDMTQRLCAANRGELERTLAGEDEDTLYKEINGTLAKWVNGTRSTTMAQTEAAMMRNEALIAGYRRAGYRSIWQAAPRCCAVCQRLNGRTISSMKPPLHTSCHCTVTRGAKIPENELQPWQTGGKIESEADVRRWIQSDACVKNVSRQKQARHRPGTKEYERYKQQIEAEGMFGPSRLAEYWTNERIERLVRERAGTGRVEAEPGIPWNMTEELYVLDPGQPGFGTVVNWKTGEEQETICIKIHYSATGIHIVPDYMSKAGKEE